MPVVGQDTNVRELEKFKQKLLSNECLVVNSDQSEAATCTYKIDKNLLETGSTFCLPWQNSIQEMSIVFVGEALILYYSVIKTIKKSGTTLPFGLIPLKKLLLMQEFCN